MSFYLVQENDKEAIFLAMKIIGIENMSPKNDFIELTPEEMKIIKDQRIISV